MRHSSRRTLAVCVCCSGALLVPTGLAGAQTPPACPPGVAVTPTFKAADQQDRNQATSLTATHVIAVAAVFPEGSPFSVDDSTARWTGPPGVPMFAHRDLTVDVGDASVASLIGFIPTAVGQLPVSVTWQQSDGTRGGVCSSSASASFSITPAKPLRPSRPRGSSSPTARDDSEYTWDTNIRTDSDRRPLEVRVRSVRGAHLPGPRVRFKTFTIALRETDPGWRARRRMLVPFMQVIGSNEGGFVHLLVGMRGVTANPKLGYELELRQGTRRVGRIRAAGSCSAFGCDFTTFRVQR